MTSYATPPIDRAAQRREDATWLAEAWNRAHVLVVAGDHALVDDQQNLAFLAPEEAPDGERYLLGTDADGTPYFAVAVPNLPTVPGRAGGDLRRLWTLLDDRDAQLLVHAVGLSRWHEAHPRCARCGGATAPALAGHVRRCPDCAAEHYPRTDPAVIMLVRDAAGRCLLGHQPQWPATRFSTLAGFVEPGESLEDAVAREVAEEVGITVTGVHYAGSQPWPFPASLMVGFFADSDGQEPVVDGKEITEAHWFTRDELANAVRERQILLPQRLSIARRLVETWFGSPISDPTR